MENKKVYAVVEDRKVTQEDLDDFLRNIGPQNAMQFQGEEGTKKAIDEIVNYELLYLDAKEKGLNKDELFQKELKKMEENFLKQYAIQQILSKVEISDEEIKKFYEDNKKYLVQPEKMRASHILVSDENEAKKIIADIQNGDKFEDKAKEFSTCPSSQNGGDLGEFARGSMVPEFEKAAFNMNIGDISNEPVKSQFGYHIIKILDKKESKIPEFNEIEGQLREQAKLAKQEREYLKTVNNLKNKFHVEYK